jgi:hypothetical protein
MNIVSTSLTRSHWLHLPRVDQPSVLFEFALKVLKHFANAALEICTIDYVCAGFHLVIARTSDTPLV